MCGRYTQTKELAVLEDRFGLKPGGAELKPRYNLAPRPGCGDSDRPTAQAGYDALGPGAPLGQGFQRCFTRP